MKLPEPLKLPDNDIETSLDSDNSMFISLSKLYTNTKLILKIKPEKHLPDVNKLLQIHQIAISGLKGLQSTDEPILKTVLNVFKGVDKTQQKIMLYQQIVNFFPIVMASTSLKIITVTNLTSNIQSLLYGLLFRYSIMLAISKFIHTHGNTVIKKITDTPRNLSLEDYNNILRKEIEKQKKETLNILNSIFSGSNLSITDKTIITEKIMKEIEFKEITNLKKFITDAVGDAVDGLLPDDIKLIANGVNGGKIRRKTRRKIRRNKKAKTKKRKVNKKTTKKKMKAKKKTKMNRKKSKRRRNKK